MRKIQLFVAVCAVAGSVVLAAEPAARPVRDQGLRVDDAAMSRAGLATTWHVKLPLAITERIESLSLLEEHVYAISDRGTLFAVRAESGLVQWQQEIALPGDVIYPVTHALAAEGLGPVVVTTASSVRMLERETGKEVGNYVLKSPPLSSAVADNERFYCTLAGQRYAAMRRKDGVESWSYTSSGASTVAPHLVGDRLLLVNNKGAMHLLEGKQRARIWHSELKAAVLPPLFVSDADLFFTTADHWLYSVDPIVGPAKDKFRWRYRLNSRPSEGPAVAGDMIFQYDPNAGLIALDKTSGEPRWTAKARRLLSVAGGQAFLQADGPVLLLVDAKTGRTQVSIPLQQVDYFPANGLTDAVFLGNRLGEIASLRSRNAKPLSMAAYLATRPASQPAASQPATAGQPSAAPAAGETGGMTAISDPLRSPTR